MGGNFSLLEVEQFKTGQSRTGRLHGSQIEAFTEALTEALTKLLRHTTLNH